MRRHRHMRYGVMQGVAAADIATPHLVFISVKKCLFTGHAGAPRRV